MQPSKPSDPPKFSADEREFLLRELRKLGDRVGALEGVVPAFKDTAGDVRELIGDFKQVSADLRAVIDRERDREKKDHDLELSLWKVSSEVQKLASRSGELAGIISGRDAGQDAGRSAARDEAKHNGAKWTVIVMLVSALTTGIIQGVRAALEPVRVPAPTHQAP